MNGFSTGFSRGFGTHRPLTNEILMRSWWTSNTEPDFCDVVAFAYGLPECPPGYP